MFARYGSQDDGEFMAPMQFLGLGAMMTLLIKVGCISPEANALTLFVLSVMYIVIFYIALVLITKYFYRFVYKKHGKFHNYLCNKYGKKKGQRIDLLIGGLIVGGLILCLLI